MNNDPFKEYETQKELSKQDKVYAWSTAIGLQAVDGLNTSKYLNNLANENIEGKITTIEANRLLESYYESKPNKNINNREEEADKVSVRIVMLFSEPTFSFTPNEYLIIHRKLFTGIYKFAGKIRDYNITKKEWVLDGKSVIYGSTTELMATLEYDFNQEKNFSYKNLSIDEIIHHLAIFISRLWQIHVFGEGNTRATAVFFIKYLRTLGFNVTNDLFAKNAWYFRNSLVRANYNDLVNNVYETTEFLELFLRNLLLNENNPLHNRTMHISNILKNKDEKVHSKCAQSALKVRLNAQETIIFDYIKKKGFITSTIFVDILNVKKRRAQIILTNLLDLKVLVRIGLSRNTRYVLAN